MPVYPQSATFRDVKGQTAVVKFFVHGATFSAAGTDAQNIVNDIIALSVAQFQGAKGPYTTSPAANTYPTPASTERYDTVEDKAVLSYETASGALHRYQIPAPKIGIFLADNETVDSANTDVAALTTDMVAAACSGDGADVTAFIGGIRTRKKLKRKFNIFTLNPQLTGPGE